MLRLTEETNPTHTFTFHLDGVLAGFKNTETDLLLILDYPGPRTLVFSEVNGRVRQIFECISRFGTEALAIPPDRDAMVCFEGEGERLPNGMLTPETAEVYVKRMTLDPKQQTRYEHLVDVPYEKLYQKLYELQAEYTKEAEQGTGAGR